MNLVIWKSTNLSDAVSKKEIVGHLLKNSVVARLVVLFLLFEKASALQMFECSHLSWGREAALK